MRAFGLGIGLAVLAMHHLASAQSLAPPDPSMPDIRPRLLPISDEDIVKYWRAGDPVAPGFHVVHRLRRSLLAPGIAVLGGSYLVSVVAVSVARFGNHSGALLVPLAGPWLLLTQRRSCNCSEDDYVRASVTASGVAQLAGLGLIVLSAVFPKATIARDSASVTILPFATAGAPGFSALGTF